MFNVSKKRMFADVFTFIGTQQEFMGRLIVSFYSFYMTPTYLILSVLIIGLFLLFFGAHKNVSNLIRLAFFIILFSLFIDLIFVWAGHISFFFYEFFLILSSFNAFSLILSFLLASICLLYFVRNKNKNLSHWIAIVTTSTLHFLSKDVSRVRFSYYEVPVDEITDFLKEITTSSTDVNIAVMFLSYYVYVSLFIFIFVCFLWVFCDGFVDEYGREFDSSIFIPFYRILFAANCIPFVFIIILI
jgi:hypothetical protein